MNSKEFSHKLFGSITIIYDGRGNVYSIGDQMVEKLKCPKDFIQETVPNEFIVFLEDVKDYGNVNIEKLIPEKYNKPDTIILKEPGIHILAASCSNSDFCVWLFSEVFPHIRGKPQQAIFY